MSEPRELDEVKKELNDDILRTMWENGCRLQGMLSSLGIESIVGTVPDKYGDQHPVISIPMKHYDELVKVIARGV